MSGSGGPGQGGREWGGYCLLRYNAKLGWSKELVWERTHVLDSSSKGPSWTRDLSYPGTFHGPGSSCHVYPGPFREGREVLRFHLQISGGSRRVKRAPQSRPVAAY